MVSTAVFRVPRTTVLRTHIIRKTNNSFKAALKFAVQVSDTTMLSNVHLPVPQKKSAGIFANRFYFFYSSLFNEEPPKNGMESLKPVTTFCCGE
jgi:hypothetical protein